MLSDTISSPPHHFTSLLKESTPTLSLSLLRMDSLLEPPITPTLPKKPWERTRARNKSKDYVTLHSFLRKLPSQHKKYKLPLTRGMTMASYLRRLGLKLGWNQVRLDHLLQS